MRAQNVFYFILLILSLSSLALLPACGKTRKQYDTGSNQLNSKPLVETPEEFMRYEKNRQLDLQNTDSKQELSASEWNTIRKNSLEDIIYGIGAAGITLDTDFETASKKLSKPYMIAKGSGYILGYKEGVGVEWADEDTKPRLPKSIMISANYLGVLRLPAPIGNISMKTELARTFESLRSSQDGDYGKKGFVRRLYQILENKPEADCLKDGNCMVIDGDGQTVLFALPQMRLEVSDDSRKAIISIELHKRDPLMDLNADFDFLRSEFLIKDQQEQLKTKVQQGSPWLQWLEAMPFLPQAFSRIIPWGVYTKDLRPMTLEIERTSKSMVPQDSDRVVAVALNHYYAHKILINGRYVKVTAKAQDDFKLDLVDSSQISHLQDGQAEVQLLKTRNSYIVKNKTSQKNFLDQFTRLFKAELERSLKASQMTENDYSIYSIITGYNSDSPLSILEANIYLKLKKDQSIRKYTVIISTFTKAINFVSYEIINEMEYYFLSHSFQEVNLAPFLHQNSFESLVLSGIHLNDIIHIKKMRKVDPETQVVVADYNGVTSANILNESDILQIYHREAQNYDLNVSENKIQTLTLPHEHGSIGLTDLGNGDYDINNVQITRMKGFKGLCGLEDFKIYIGMAQTEFEQALKKADQELAIRSSRDPKKAKSCTYYALPDPKSSGQKRVYQFPEQRLRLAFKNRELSFVMIYKNLQESLVR